MREEQEEDRKVGVFSMRAGRPHSGSLQRTSSRGRSDDPNVPPSLGFQSTGFQSTGAQVQHVLSNLRPQILIPLAFCAAMSLRRCILTFGCCLAAEIKPGSLHRILAKLFHFCSGVFFLRALQQESMQP